MRKITELAVDKFFNMENFKRDNIAVYHTPGEVEMLLFGNIIAKYHIREWIIELLDWWHQTPTTKERLNWILSKMGRWYVYQLAYHWYYRDEHWKVRPFNKGIARNILSRNRR